VAFGERWPTRSACTLIRKWVRSCARSPCGLDDDAARSILPHRRDAPTRQRHHSGRSSTGLGFRWGRP